MRTCVLLPLMLVLVGCKSNLYSDLDQKEANEMLAVLLQQGLSGDKIPGDEGRYILRVDESEIARAVTLLKSQGYPRDKFDSMGDVFQKEGLISSPMEERIRFIYALSQEIAGTISSIDGVLSARVHIVLPENNPLNETLHPSSASVFIKYRPDADVLAKIPKIKNLVVNSIEGLTYDKVTVAGFPGQVTPEIYEPALTSVLGMRVSSGSAMPLQILFALLAISLVVAALIYVRQLKRKREVEHV